MSSAVKILPHYNYDDYCQWEGRWELIEGIPYAMSPAPVPEHQRISAAIMGEFRDALKKASCSLCKVYNFIDYKVADDIILQPDMLIVCNSIDKKFLDFCPALVVEILSPATAMKDRNNKFTIYQSQKIPYYLIIDVDKTEIEIYKLNETGDYLLIPHDSAQPFTFHLGDDCQPGVVLNNIWE